MEERGFHNNEGSAPDPTEVVPSVSATWSSTRQRRQRPLYQLTLFQPVEQGVRARNTALRV